MKINKGEEKPTLKIYSFVRQGVKTIDPLTIDDKKDVTIRFAKKVTIDEKRFKNET